jgi:hypothetical protein
MIKLLPAFVVRRGKEQKEHKKIRQRRLGARQTAEVDKSANEKLFFPQG